MRTDVIFVFMGRCIKFVPGWVSPATRSKVRHLTLSLGYIWNALKLISRSNAMCALLYWIIQFASKGSLCLPSCSLELSANCLTMYLHFYHSRYLECIYQLCFEKIIIVIVSNIGNHYYHTPCSSTVDSTFLTWSDFIRKRRWMSGKS